MDLKEMLRPGLGRLGTYEPRDLLLPRDNLQRPPKESLPLISVVIPSFNQGKFIRETLDSLLAQRYPKLEIIVVDGGSSDETLDVLREYHAHIAWWVSEPDTGQSNALNKGFARSSGELMGWVNADDCLAPGALIRIAAYFSDHPTADVLYGNRILINQHGSEVGRWILPAHCERVLKLADFVPQETLYWRRSAWRSVGEEIDEGFDFAMDWDLLLRFVSAKQKIVHIPHFLGLFRVHGDQKTSSQMADVGSREIERLRFRELGFLPSRRQIIINTVPFLMASKWLELKSWCKTKLFGSHT